MHFTPTCALCGRTITKQEARRIVPIATRTNPLFVHGETWGECCAPLVYGLKLYLGARLPKEIR